MNFFRCPPFRPDDTHAAAGRKEEAEKLRAELAELEKKAKEAE